MSLTTAPRCRSLIRVGTAGLVVAASSLLGTSTASAAEDERPVIALDPPDVAVFLVSQEEEGGILGRADPAASPAEESGPAASALAQAAAALPPEVASALGAQAEATVAVAPEDYGVDVPHESTIRLQIPAEVDASSAAFVLDVFPPDEEDLPLRYKTDPMPSDEPLPYTDLGGGAFDIAIPEEVDPYGPGALLTVDGLIDAETGAELYFPLMYALELTAPTLPPATVNLAPTVGILSHATCSFDGEEACPGPTVRAGRSVDLVVPPDSLLSTWGFAQLDTAFFSLESVDGEEPYEVYDSESDPELVTAHGPSSATLTVPAGARPAPYFGTVLQGDPSTGIAITVFEMDVEGVAVNPGLHSDTGWVEEVREVSPGSTAAVAGGALLLVSGLVGVAAVRPGRRPPLGG